MNLLCFIISGSSKLNNKIGLRSCLTSSKNVAKFCPFTYLKISRQPIVLRF